MARGQRDFDLIILGGGSAGIVSGVLAGALGLRVLLIEKNQMGGECLNTGCVPSKALIHAARVAHTLRTEAAAVGLPVREISRDAAGSALAWVRKTIGTVRDADATEKLLRDKGVTIRLGDARFLDAHTLQVNARGEGTSAVSADNFLIATGSRPRVPGDIPGLSEVPYRTNQTIFDLTEVPGRMLVVGGGPIGVEMAQAFSRLGSQVTLVQKGERLLPRDDAELVARLTSLLRAESIDIRVSADLTRIETGNQAVVTDALGMESVLPFDCLLLAVGRTPNVEGLALDAAGVQTENGTITVNKRLQTSASHIYACGDVIDDGYRFSHLAEYQAKIAVRNLVFPGESPTEYRSAPWATFTEPELAHVGLTEEEAKHRGIAVEVYRQPFAQNDRALTDGGSADPARTGLVKVLVDPGIGGKILGAQILGPRAGELLQEWVLAMEQGHSIRAIADMVHVYPTLSLASQHAAQRWYERQSENPVVDGALRTYVEKIRPREKALAAGVLGVLAAGFLIRAARRRDS
jgi:pyruvate/2-oxoglutarate dehydrogenase complex dihydrolipoamide dehydrogenase (E3) component